MSSLSGGAVKIVRLAVEGREYPIKREAIVADQKQKLVAELTEILERLVRLVRELKAGGIDPEEIAAALPPDLLQAVEGLFNE